MRNLCKRIYLLRVVKLRNSPCGHINVFSFWSLTCPSIPNEVKNLFGFIYFQILRRKYIIFNSQFEEKEMRVKSIMFSKQDCVLWLAELATELWLYGLFLIPTQAIIFCSFFSSVFKGQYLNWQICFLKMTSKCNKVFA